jgi:hypothetical protein
VCVCARARERVKESAAERARARLLALTCSSGEILPVTGRAPLAAAQALPRHRRTCVCMRARACVCVCVCVSYRASWKTTVPGDTVCGGRPDQSYASADWKVVEPLVTISPTEPGEPATAACTRRVISAA